MAALSKRIEEIPASAIRKLVPLADQAKARGVFVYHLNIGDPDIPTPAAMIERLRAWEGEGVPYAHSQGDGELVAALADYYRDLGYSNVGPEQIQVSVGGSEAFAMAMTACCDAGDEVIVFEPFFVGYASLAPVYGVKLVPLATTIETGFHLPPVEQIEAQMTERTKAILLTNPNNPTGTVYSRDEVESILELAAKRDLYVWADEVYREFVFDGREGVSLLGYLERYPERLLVLDSLSKRYSAPGLRLGAVVSLNQELMAGVLRMAMGRLSAGYIDQKVAAQLTKVSQTDLLVVRDEYQRRRDVVYAAVKSMSGVVMSRPEGAFYAVLGLPVEDGEAFCRYLLTDFEDNQETVMLAPMSGFYVTPGKGKNEVRVAYVLGVEKLQRAMDLLRLALARYPSSQR